MTRLINIYKHLYIISGYPYVYHEKMKMLLLADLHLGYEEAMAEEGVYLPKAQLTYFKKEFDEIYEKIDIEKLVIIGDLKHRFDKLSRQERSEISETIDHLKKKGISEIILVRGNHDNYVSPLLKKYDVKIIDYMIIDDMLLIHGHVDPLTYSDLSLDNINMIIYGHEHPSIVLRDRLGKIAKLPVFLDIPLKIDKKIVRGVILPAAGYYQLGSSITTDPEKYLSPITKKYGDINMMRPYAVLRGEGLLEMPPIYMMLDFIEI